MLGIKHVFATAFHPQGNALVETIHRRLRLSLAVESRSATALSFREALQLAAISSRGAVHAMSSRGAVHAVTGETLSFVLTGRDLLLGFQRNWFAEPTSTLSERLAKLAEV
eukprot:GHVP01006839.1.p2 GENE.GHVP01006839.1~~GHVP01006839.1.p2  ORF type:complete len:111 (+),score=1.84 GHVP01006839.1:394-726(+)